MSENLEPSDFDSTDEALSDGGESLNDSDSFNMTDYSDE